VDKDSSLGFLAILETKIAATKTFFLAGLEIRALNEYLEQRGNRQE
jgi:hypothetical protein